MEGACSSGELTVRAVFWASYLLCILPPVLENPLTWYDGVMMFCVAFPLKTSYLLFSGGIGKAKLLDIIDSEHKICI